MSAQHPNHLRLNCGETSFGCAFGHVLAVNTVHFTHGNGHAPHVQARFTGGVKLDFTPQTFIELLREGQAAVAELPFSSDMIRDACGEAE